MQRTQNTLRLGTIAAVVTAAMTSGATSAATLYFDTNGATNGLGGSGSASWSTSVGAWQTTTSPGTAAPGVWIDGSDAYFHDSSKTANVSGTVEVGDISATAGGSNQNKNITSTGTVRWGGDIVIDVAGNAPNLTISNSGGLILTSGGLQDIAYNRIGGSTNSSTVTISADISESVAGSGLNLTKLPNTSSGIITLVLSGDNSYTGGTTLTRGVLRAESDNALGTGDVTIAASQTLTLQNATLNDYIDDTANLILNNTATINLNFVGTDVIGGLSFDGGTTILTSGLFNSTSHPSIFSGTGSLLVVIPEPASLALLGLGGLLMLPRRRRGN